MTLHRRLPYHGDNDNKARSYGYEKIIAILLITIMAIGAAACQKTPESPIVIGKDYETMIEQAMTSDESTAEKALKDAVQAPDNFVFNYSSDSLSISSNVQLNLPEVPKVSIFRQNQGISRLNRH